MLRASALAGGSSVDLRALTDRAEHSGVADGPTLLAFAAALVRVTPATGPSLDEARRALLDALDAQAVVRAAAVVANFEMMNRLVDATGVPVGPSLRAIADDLGLDPGPGPTEP